MVGVAVSVDVKGLGPMPPAGPTPFLVYLLTILAVIGAFLFGYDCGVVAGAMVIVKDVWHDVDDTWQSLIISVTTAAAAVFSLVAAPLNERFGRKIVILSASALFAIGAVICGAAPNKEVLLVGRVIIGIGLGLSSATVPQYIAETSPPHLRGRMITTFQLLITFGFFTASVLDAAFSYLPNDISWKLMLGVAGVPAILQFVGFFFMPESPRWLATHDRIEEARKILLRVTSNHEMAEWELKAIEISHTEAEADRAAHGNRNALLIMMEEAPLRRALAVGCLLQFFQQFSGVNTVMYYSTTIILNAGITDETLALWLSCIITAVNFLCTFLGIYLVERLGRRKLVLLSMAGVILCLILLGIGFTLIEKGSPGGKQMFNHSDHSYWADYDPEFFDDDTCWKKTNCDSCSYTDGCGFCYTNADTAGICMKADAKSKFVSYNGTMCSKAQAFNYSTKFDDTKFANGYCPSDVFWLPILGMVLFLCSFSCGLGPVPWTMNAEIYPTFVRSLGNGIATATNWVISLIISLTFLMLSNAITREGAFFLYAGITACGWVIFFFTIPETKDKTLEQLEHIFNKPLCGSVLRKSSINPYEEILPGILIQDEKLGLKQGKPGQANGYEADKF